MTFKGFFIGKLIAAQTKSGVDYHDWRESYVGLAGLVEIYEDEEGREMFFFFPEKTGLSERLRTSLGHSDYDAGTGRLRLRTRNSVYIFVVDADAVPEKEIRRLFAVLSCVETKQNARWMAMARGVNENGYYELKGKVGTEP